MIRAWPRPTHCTLVRILRAARGPVVASGLLVASGLACKPKECDAVLETSGKVQAALLEHELSAAKDGLDAVVDTAASSEANEIKWLSHNATRLANAIEQMQRPNPPADDRDRISTELERHKSSFIDARTDVRRVCE